MVSSNPKKKKFRSHDDVNILKLLNRTLKNCEDGKTHVMWGFLPKFKKIQVHLDVWLVRL